MARKHLSNEARKQIINLVFNKQKTIKEAANILDINYKTAAKVCRVFNVENRIDKKVPEKKRKFGPELDDHIRTYFSMKQLATLNDCRKHLAETCNLSPSVSTIYNTMKRIKLSLKDVVVVPAERNSESTIKLRKQYVSRFLHLESAGVNFVFVDEFGCNLSLRRRKGYSIVGTPCHVVASGKRGNNLSVCAAIDVNGPIYYQTKFLAFNQVEFVDFLKNLNAKLDKSKRNVIVMDNAAFHKTDLVRNFFKENSLAYLYLPPYSPMLNPIEECFSKVKNLIKKLLYDGRDLLVAVEEAFNAITSANCCAWFGHTKQFFPQCINEQPITNIPEDLEHSDEDESVEFDEMLASLRM